MLFIFQLISFLISWNFLINVKKMLHRLLLTAHWLELVFNETNTCFYRGCWGTRNWPLMSMSFSLWPFRPVSVQTDRCCIKIDYRRGCKGWMCTHKASPLHAHTHICLVNPVRSLILISKLVSHQICKMHLQLQHDILAGFAKTQNKWQYVKSLNSNAEPRLMPQI